MSGHGNNDIAIDSHGQNAETSVVDVLTDQIDTTRGARNEFGCAAINSLETSNKVLIADAKIFNRREKTGMRFRIWRLKKAGWLA